MQEIQPIVDHLINVYGFELTPCNIPRSEFQYFKRNLYIFILNKINKKLFYFIRDNISPIKYLKEREDKIIWFIRRFDDKSLSTEISIIPIPIEDSIYTCDSKSIFKPSLRVNFKVEIFNKSDICIFPINIEDGVYIIDSHLVDYPIFKQIHRDYTLNKIFTK